MKTGASLKNRQGGAVAVMVGISMVMLIGFLALVIDLGHLYVAKTGLQNAADAAALSGARELNETKEGVELAKNKAIEAAGKNTFFGDMLGYQSVSLSDANIKFSDAPYTPDSAWKSYSEAYSEPRRLYFVKVDTDQQNLNTWFAVIWNIFNMSTYGRAVAGSDIVNVAPIGVCAIDPADDPDDSDGIYYGFDRGIAYDVAEINRLLLGLAKGTPLWLHPTAMTDEQCKDDVNFASASKFRPFLCLGESAAGKSLNVYANTGWEASQEGAINTRFRPLGDTQDSKYANMPAQFCAPDKNVKEFLFPPTGTNCTPVTNCSTYTKKKDCTDASCNWDEQAKICTPNPLPAECSVDWLTYTPDQQSADLVVAGNKITDTFGQSVKDVIATYKKPVDESVLNSNYPSTSPYQAGIDSGKYHADPYKPDGVTPTEGRRLINIVIINCSTGLKLNGVCEELPKLGVAQFFMPVRADLNKQTLYLEFVKMMPSRADSGKIKLFQ